MIPILVPLFFPTLLQVARAQTAESFAWDQLAPSADLNWVDCYSAPLQCARLEVPLDYSDSSAGTTALAVIRIPANVSKEEYRGPVLFNPGGPGGSGVETLVDLGAALAAIAGPKFDVVSFDPRGVVNSSPAASFFASEVERALWNAGSLPVSLNASDAAIPNAWGRSHLLGQLAAQRDTSGILKYMTTDNVARDMLRITQKFGFEKLKYYGVSYGSLIGTTFATLFPDKVERIIVDGVLDAAAWFNANLTIEAAATDAVLQTFFDGCVAAGPDLCAFFKPTAEEIADRLAALTNAIRVQPVPAITPTSYGLVDYSLLRDTIFNSLYSPYQLFPALAQGLAALESGDGSVLFAILAQPQFACNCGGSNGTAPDNGDQAVIAIQCGDAVEVADTIEELTAFYDNAAKTSQFVEFLVGSNRIGCSGWQTYREGRFLGPTGAANTSFPLLFIANTADPVTPKQAALATMAGFPGSALLVQDSPGHTSNAAPSLCTTGYIQAYLNNGTLPAPGTVCPVDATLFGAPATSNSTLGGRHSGLSDEDAQTIAALRRIGDAIRPVISRLGRM